MEPLSEISAMDADYDDAVDGKSDENNSSSIERFKMDSSGITLQIILKDGRCVENKSRQINNVTFKNELIQHTNRSEHQPCSRKQPNVLCPPQDQSLFL